jgi:hypothetical protein
MQSTEAGGGGGGGGGGSAASAMLAHAYVVHSLDGSRVANGRRAPFGHRFGNGKCGLGMRTTNYALRIFKDDAQQLFFCFYRTAGTIVEIMNDDLMLR